ncbi:hypothetical protein GF406_12280 [candidate division KSB1 bacterium]|jgi:hypothetical protein|nr:hypothetical protein [candidate division KSB1 bacterium]
MKTISLKVDETVFGETEKIVSLLQKSRNRYINDAIEHYNKLQKRRLIAERIKKESLIVRDDSMAVLKEFEILDNED